MDENFTTDQVRVLAAQIAQRLIALYGAHALEEALNVVAMLVELGREELIPVWRRAALDIAEIDAERTVSLTLPSAAAVSGRPA